MPDLQKKFHYSLDKLLLIGSYYFLLSLIVKKYN
jgi:hypothetical protein